MADAPIMKLTPEQEAHIDVVRERWQKYALCTDKADRPLAEQGVDLAFSTLKLPLPKWKFWAASPLAGCAMIEYLIQRNTPKTPAHYANKTVAHTKLPQYRDFIPQVDKSIDQYICDRAWFDLCEQVKYLWGEDNDSVLSAADLKQLSPEARKEEQAKLPLKEWLKQGPLKWTTARSSIKEHIHLALWGQFDAGWLGWAEFWHETVGISEESLGLRFIGKSAGWWWAAEEVVILTERPTIISIDDQFRLHHETGPALAYPDGCSVYAWHGIIVTQNLIEHPEMFHASDILAERNAELARVMMEKIGIERFTEEAEPKILDKDVDGGGQPRRLLSIDMPNDPDRRVVVCHVQCPSTGHQYFLRVPPHVSSCAQAIAWTMGINAVEDYHPLQEA